MTLASGATSASATQRALSKRNPGILDQLDIIFTADLDGTIQSWAPCAAAEATPYGNLVGRNLAEFLGAKRLSAGRNDLSLAELFESLNDGRFEGLVDLSPQADESAYFALTLTLLRDAAGLPTGILGLVSPALHNRAIVGSAPTAADVAVPLGRREIDGTHFLIASPIMHKFMGMVDRVAGHTETVLVIGETGTGKELVARTIHESSYRRKKPFVDINCAALPEHLVESELFGYEKGAFSGADSSKPGLFEMAHESTIFLDEIGELQPQIQVKLLRVLDGAPFFRLGGSRKIKVDVRVVAATNQDLELAVKEGRFRKDLFHRLSQFQLRVPPLRERPEDVAALAQHFLSIKAAGKTFTAGALAALQAYPWPGNIRELRNLVAKLAMDSEEPQIAETEIMSLLWGEAGAPPSTTGAVPFGNLENMEEQMIIRALDDTGGRRAEAAAKLGISRRTLSRKLRAYDIAPPAGHGPAKLGVISEEQQKFFRAKVDLSVTLRNAKGGGLQVHAFNLSTGGMGLDAIPDPTGFAGLVDVSFLLPESEVDIHAKGRLIWTEPGGRAGLRFIVIPPALFDKLQQWTTRKMKEEGWEIPS